MAKTEKSMKTR